MNTNYVERHICALGVAMQCAALGARSRTIEYITGLSHGEIGRLFFADRSTAPRGRPPASPEWYHSANLLNRAEASIFVCVYRRMRTLGFRPGEALVSGYRHYRALCSVHPRVTFDRAFDLASHVDGLWLVRTPNFSLVACATCKCQYITAPGSCAVASDCPFCKLVRRYACDPRLQASFPGKPVPDVGAMDIGRHALSAQREACG